MHNLRNNPSTMKNPTLLLLAALTFSACNTDDDNNGIQQLAGTYIGAMNISEPSFQSTAYMVMRLSANRSVSSCNSSK